jgi:uncharacterized membrane protein
MKKITFPAPLKHEHIIKNVNDLFKEKLAASVGQRAADRVALIVGSWKFIIIQTLILSVWALLNVTAWVYHWDPYPFILMNLFLSLQAAYTAPVIMMSQNRLSEKDRIDAHNDYELNIKAETEVRTILEHLEAQNEALRKILEQVSPAEEQQ